MFSKFFQLLRRILAKVFVEEPVEGVYFTIDYMF